MNSKYKKRRIGAVFAILLALVLTVTGCSSSTGTADATSVDTTSGASKSEMFTDRDLSGDYDESEAETIELDGESITITEEGVYIISGTLDDGQIIVNADDSAKVQIVLNGASITSKTSAAIYVVSADKVFITTAEGTENTLANGGTFEALEGDDTNIDGAVFAHDDITFNGSGTLNIVSPAGHGIVGKDDVKIAGGTVNIEAADKGVTANDSIRIAEATITITSDDDAIHVSDNSDEEEGTDSDSFFYMADGTLTVSTGDDGIHADYKAIIEGGNITVSESYEGIEALEIEISGGNIDVTASDDGLNAAGGSDSSNSNGPNADGFGGGFDEGGDEGVITISGGNIKIQASGDGIDSNGSLEITGGYTVVEGPTQGDTSVLDYNTTATISGGTFIGTGGSSMAVNFTSAEQGLIAVSVGNQSSGSTVTLTDSDGNTVAEVTPEQDYAIVYVSTEAMASGSSYTLEAGSYSETIELSDNIYSSISGGMGGQGSMGGGEAQMPSGGKGGSSDSDSDQSGLGGKGGKGGGTPPSGAPGGTDGNGSETNG